jgi:hypothetical protein
MTKYQTVVEYYNRRTGEQLSKKLAERDYDIIRKWKTIKVKDETKARGYEYKTITITHIKECEESKQLKLYKNGKN